MLQDVRVVLELIIEDATFSGFAEECFFVGNRFSQTSRSPGNFCRAEA